MELDSFDGHHYVSSVAPGGPADKHGVLRPEDELLEVSGVPQGCVPEPLYLPSAPSRGPRGPGGPGATDAVGALLQVNGVQLYGKSRREVVSFLKEAPPPFTLVCCRRLTSDLEPESETESEPEPAPKPGPGFMRTPPPSVEEVGGPWNTHTHTHIYPKVTCGVFFRLSCSCPRCCAARQNLQRIHR